MSPMEIYILCDMEGITGASSYEGDVFPTAPNYPTARRWLTDDLKAAMIGARAAGAEQFIIYDMHFQGRNILAGELTFPCTLIEGKPMANGMREGMSAMYMIGLHAMAGHPTGVLPHTYNHEIRRIELNGMAVGEIGLETAAAGAYGIPLALVAADREGCAEAKALLGAVETAAVKWRDEQGRIIHRDPYEARQEIAHAAFRAVARAGKLAPFRVSGPCELRVQCETSDFRDVLHRKCGGQCVGENELLLQGHDLLSVYSQFRKSQARL